jgi:hypothetical protein
MQIDLTSLLLGFFLGIIGNVVVNYIWDLRTRYQAHANATKLVGNWTAHNIEGRNVDTRLMPGSGITEIRSKRRWSADSHVLAVQSTDTCDDGSKRTHHGSLVLDSRFPRLATRVVIYDDSGEVSEQRIVVSSDFQTLYVFPIAMVATLGDAYGKHALRKQA